MKNSLLLGLGTLLLFTGCTNEETAPVDNSQSIQESSLPSSTVSGSIKQPSNGLETSETLENKATATYTLQEVMLHNTPEDCWTVINGEVADVTSFFGKHPGGDDNLQKACGKEATAMFESVKKHDPDGYKALQNFTIGVLKEE